MPKLDLAALANACYTLVSSEQSWLQGIVNVLRPLLDRGMGIAAWSFRVGDWGRSDPPPVGVDLELGKAIRAVCSTVSSTLAAQVFLGPRAKPGCERIGNTTGLDRDPSFAAFWPFRIRDFHALTVLDGRGFGVALLSPELHVIKSNRAMTRALERVGTHVLAGFRLRRALGQVDAVFEPDSRLVDAGAGDETEAREPGQPAALQSAVKALDQTWSKRATKDWEAALETWQGLVSGRWSLVQSFESGGRRYLVARRSLPAELPGRALQPLVAHALILRARGASYKQLAGELGISIAGAHQLVKHSCQRLGIRDEHELPLLLSALFGTTHTKPSALARPRGR